MIKMTAILLAVLGMSSFALAIPKVTRKPMNAVSFMPENNLHMYDRFAGNSNIDEKTFNQIIDQTIELFKPVVASHGANLVIEKKWDDSTVNAYASQAGNTWTVAMFGGLARRPEVTPDGFALVVCHELGHHLGGYVFKGTRWAAAEGQSDYFATQVCARAIWGFQNDLNNRWRGVRFSDTVKAKCDSIWKNETAKGWCYRTSAAGLSLAQLLSALGGEKVPSFDTPDTTVVTSTDTNHPHGQCRLDTYFAGALCAKNFDLREIPGKVGDSGQTTVAAEVESAKFSCYKEDGFAEGNRPNCWFKSLRSAPIRRR